MLTRLDISVCRPAETALPADHSTASGLFVCQMQLVHYECKHLMSHLLVCCLQDFGSDLSLDTYMQLPVEQYYELDPTMIRPLGGKRFALQVPRVNVGACLFGCMASLPACLPRMMR